MPFKPLNSRERAGVVFVIVLLFFPLLRDKAARTLLSLISNIISGRHRWISSLDD